MDYPADATSSSGGKPLLMTPNKDNCDMMNQVVWSLMHILEAQGMSGTAFDPTVTASYQKLALAIQSMIDTSVNTVQDKLVGLGGVVWYPSRTVIPAAFQPADGQLVTRATYPGITAILANLPNVAEATWTTDATKRGSYSMGDGSTNFRFPDYNGKYSTDPSLFLRGDGNNAAAVGVVQAEAFKSHTHTFHQANANFSIDNVNLAYPRAASAGAAGFIDSTGGPETRPNNVAGVWCIRAA